MIWLHHCIIQPLPTGEHVHMFSLHLDWSHSLLFGASHSRCERKATLPETLPWDMFVVCVPLQPFHLFMDGISWTEATRWSKNNQPIHIKGGLFIWRPCLDNCPQGLHCCLCFSCIYYQQQNIWLVSLIKVMIGIRAATNHYFDSRLVIDYCSQLIYEEAPQKHCTLLTAADTRVLTTGEWCQEALILL